MSKEWRKQKQRKKNEENKTIVEREKNAGDLRLAFFWQEIDTRKKNINALLMITLFFFSFFHTLASVCEAEEKNKTVAIQNWRIKSNNWYDLNWVKMCVKRAKWKLWFVYLLFVFIFFILRFHIRYALLIETLFSYFRIRLICAQEYVSQSMRERRKVKFRTIWMRHGARDTERERERKCEAFLLQLKLSCMFWIVLKSTPISYTCTGEPESEEERESENNRDIDPNFMDLHNMPVE